MKVYRLNQKREMFDYLRQLLERCIVVHVKTYEERMFVAVLAEIKLKIDKRMVEYKKEYRMELSTAQAMALHILWTDYQHLIDNLYIRTKLMQIAHDINHEYSHVNLITS